MTLPLLVHFIQLHARPDALMSFWRDYLKPVYQIYKTAHDVYKAARTLYDIRESATSRAQTRHDKTATKRGIGADRQEYKKNHRRSTTSSVKNVAKTNRHRGSKNRRNRKRRGR